jgi:pyruvate-formate lyase-activating enzyme
MAVANDVPRYVMMELTNACDLKCRHCPYHGDGVVKQRPVGTMSDAVWRRALAEVISWDTPVVLQPWGMGEPLLAPQLWDVVAAAKRSPRLEVGFYSNGNQWTPADVERAIDTGLDWVTFSIDGLRPDVFAHYRVGADLDRVLGTVRALADARRRTARDRPHLRVNMVQYPELADHGDEFVAAMRGLVDTVMISRFRRVGDRRFSPIELPRVPCYQLDVFLGLAWDGTVMQCCEDQQGESPVGRFPAQSLREIWHAEPLAALRAAHREGRWDASPLCKDCDAWTGVYEREHTAGGVRVRERTATTVHEFGAPASPSA